MLSTKHNSPNSGRKTMAMTKRDVLIWAMSAILLTTNVGSADLVAHWSFDDPIDPGHDDSGNGNDGIVVGATSTSGKVGNGLWFDGFVDYVNCGASSAFEFADPDSAFSVSLWAKFDVLPDTTDALVSKWNQTPNGGWLLGHAAFGKLYMMFSQDADFQYGGVLLMMTDNLVKDNWYHITYVVDVGSDTFLIYVDGDSKQLEHPHPWYDETIDTIHANNAFLAIGASADYSNYAQASLDEVRVYNRALSQADVMELTGAPQPPRGKLLVRSHNGSDWDLYIINEDGTDPQAIDVTSSHVDQAVFSPDGRMILYSAETTSGSRSIFHVSVDGGTPELVPGVSERFGHGLCWGDESGHFYYDELLHYSCGASTWALHKRALDGPYDEIVMTSHSRLWDVLEALNKIACKENVPLGCYSGVGRQQE